MDVHSAFAFPKCFGFFSKGADEGCARCDDAKGMCCYRKVVNISKQARLKFTHANEVEKWMGGNFALVGGQTPHLCPFRLESVGQRV